MVWVFEKILLPLIIGIVAGLIVQLIKGRVTGSPFSLMTGVGVGLVLGLLLMVVIILLPRDEMMGVTIEFIRPQEGDRVSSFTDVEYKVLGSPPTGYRDVLLVEDPLGQYWSWGTPVAGNIKAKRVQIGVQEDKGRRFRIIILITDRDIPLGTPYQTLPQGIYQNSITVTRQ